MFRRFLAGRKLELCVEKTKMLVFNRKGWKKNLEIGKKIIEKIQIFKYLSFVLNRKGNYREQIKVLAKKKKNSGEKDMRFRWEDI